MKEFIKKLNKLISIIIRTKNEEEWITKCLQAVFAQKDVRIEVIIVDNKSSDTTLSRAKEFDVKIIEIDKYLPGLALNYGISNSNGEIICCLSGHCVPTDEYWLTNLIKPLSNKEIAGTYGRQVPTENSDPLDVRDLVMLFRNESFIQSVDSFFHNANSAFLKSTWLEFPFCDESTNIEDRIWGEQIIKSGYKIAYVSEACVYHWHGVNHGLDRSRAKNIARILDKISNLKPKEDNSKNLKFTTCLAIIPIKGETVSFQEISLLEKTINSLKSTNLVNEIIVTTDNEKTAKKAEDLGVRFLMRPDSLSTSNTSLADVLKFTLEELENKGEFYDIVAVAEEIYPFRNKEIVKNMIELMLSGKSDTIYAAWEEKRITWYGTNDELEVLGGNSWVIKKNKNEDNVLTSLTGYLLLVKPSQIRKKSLFSSVTEAYVIKDPIAVLAIHSQSELERVINHFRKTINL
ncbi:hypothetical protein EU96_1553 [Prochlorococcus marinus str. MIT 9302]|uniref:Glycosyltransferase 2-like domain-containing protein n=1 Tax=Prochlorococcus marinus str. MIT 9302 TaxID=74545 RepID=A0A0A2A5N8_PROMR|nr:hypothetical protein EU96_1553 [Prochlorococcus marinus str. MIT 9302]